MNADQAKASIGRVTMDDRHRAAIRNVKQRITSMLEERTRLPATAGASAYWSDFCSYFEYVLTMSDEAFAQLRVHTYHLTGDNYLTYYFGHDAARILGQWRALTAGTPPALVLSEPEGGMGFETGDGHVVSQDLLRFQRVVNVLEQHRLLSPPSRPTILEIGAGYAALALHLSRLVGGASYVIVDLPETLLFAGAYLSLHAPDKRIYMYQPDDFDQVLAAGPGAYDFVLVPNYKLQELRAWGFDLVVNVASLQEMRTDQVREYLDFIAATCTGTFYSWNRDAQPRNRELTSLSSLLAERFDITEVPLEASSKPGLRAKLNPIRKALRRAAAGLRRSEAAKPASAPYRQYICRPRQTSAR